MKATVYMETSVVSYLTSRPSRDVVMAGHQASTVTWWREHRSRFDLFISPLVWHEACQGDAEAVKRRLKVIRPLRLLQIRRDSVRLSRSLVDSRMFPENARADAMHVALAATHGMEFLLTWNFAHIANATIENDIRRICREHGVEMPVICSPDELKQV